MGVSSRSVMLALAATTVFIGAGSGAAHAADLGSLAGRWCGTTADYVFSRKTISVRLHSGARRDHPITASESRGEVVTVHWMRDNKEMWTKFTGFDAKGNMVQLANEGAKEMPFHRC
jgi:hypothetical protein